MSALILKLQQLVATLSLLLATSTPLFGAAPIVKPSPYVQTAKDFAVEKPSSIEAAGAIKTLIDKTEPKVTLQKWNGEASLGVSYAGQPVFGAVEKDALNAATVDAEDKVVWTDKAGKQDVYAYPLAATAQMEDGGFEMEISLNEAPASNVFDFQLENYGNLDFFYQPALTPQEIAGGAERPDNVIGSYAVYYKNHADHVIGKTNYATGKAYHIFRPKAVDANGDEAWANLSYDNAGTLSVTVPQKFLDTAVYPMKVDPTFGYTAAGGSVNRANDAIQGTRFLSPTDMGTPVDMQLYCNISTVGAPMKGVIVVSSTVTLLSNGVGAASSNCSAQPGWRVSTFSTSTPPAPASSTNYVLSGITTGGNAGNYYDSGGPGWIDTTNSYASPTDPSDGSGVSRTYSIYLEYTATIPPCAASWTNGYTYCRPFTISQSSVTSSESQANFPLLLTITTSSYLKTTSTDASNGRIQNVQGFDLMFTTDSSGNTTTSFEVERYVSSTGELEAWVKLPTLNATSATSFFMFYGKSGVGSFQASSTATWDSNFRAVYHLGSGTTSTSNLIPNDSTANGYNLTLQASPTKVDGKIDGAVTLNGTTQWLDNSSFNLSSTAMTMEVWASSTILATQSAMLIELEPINSNGEIYSEASFACRGGGTGNTLSVSPASNNTMHHLACTISGTLATAYIDGAFVATGTVDALPSPTSTTINLGRYSGAGGGYYYSGYLDEARISSIARSAAWIYDEYQNQNNPSTYFSIGNEQNSTAAAASSTPTNMRFRWIFED